MPARPFLDTNILVYAVAKGNGRAAAASRILSGGAQISVHVLNEFANVAHRKLALSWADIGHLVDDILRFCPDPVEIDLALHVAARRIAERLGYRIFESMVIAAALRARCDVLLTEDMQHGQVIDGRMTICNPFLAL